MVKMAKYVLIALCLVGISAVAQRPSAQSSRSQDTEVNGQIQDSQGQPLPQAVVQLHDSSGGLLATEITDAAGNFAARVGSQGPFRIDVSDGSTLQSEDLDPASLSNFVMRLPDVHVAAPLVTSSSVSLNDLEAPKAAKSILAKAEKSLDHGQFDAAWTLANEAVKAAPDWGKAYFVRGVLNLQNKDFSAARADLTKSLQQNPHNPAALTELGKLYSTTGAYQLSDTYLRQALQYPPVLWPTYWELATLDLDRGQNAEAVTMATNAEYATPPAPIGIHFLAGVAAYRLRHWDQAQQEFSTYVELAAKDPLLTNWTEQARRYLTAIATSAPASAAAQPATIAH